MQPEILTALATILAQMKNFHLKESFSNAEQSNLLAKLDSVAAEIGLGYAKNVSRNRHICSDCGDPFHGGSCPFE